MILLVMSVEGIQAAKRNYIGQQIYKNLCESNWITKDPVNLCFLVGLLKHECHLDVVRQQLSLEHLQCPPYRRFHLNLNWRNVQHG